MRHGTGQPAARRSKAAAHTARRGEWARESARERVRARECARVRLGRVRLRRVRLESELVSACGWESKHGPLAARFQLAPTLPFDSSGVWAG